VIGKISARQLITTEPSLSPRKVVGPCAARLSNLPESSRRCACRGSGPSRHDFGTGRLIGPYALARARPVVGDPAELPSLQELALGPQPSGQPVPILASRRTSHLEWCACGLAEPTCRFRRGHHAIAAALATALTEHIARPNQNPSRPNIAPVTPCSFKEQASPKPVLLRSWLMGTQPTHYLLGSRGRTLRGPAPAPTRCCSARETGVPHQNPAHCRWRRARARTPRLP